MTVMRNVECGMLRARSIAFGGLALVIMTTLNAPAEAEIKIIETDYTYIMGDNDSKVDARRIAVQESKRKAFDQSGTYLESLTEVKNYQLTNDELRAYSAGLVETEIVADEMRGSAARPELYIKTRCTVDTALLAAAIERYRDNEELKEQARAAAKENEQLKKERDSLVKQLAGQKNKKKAEETRRKLDNVLVREETNQETDKVWAAVAHAVCDGDERGPEVSEADLDQSASVLERIIKVNPGNQRALYLLAAIYQKKGNHEAAEKQARSAIQKNPSNPVPHMKLGTLLRSQSRHKDALKEFHFVERIRPHNPMMLYYTGMTLKDMERCGPSVQYLQRFLNNKAVVRYPAKKQIALQAIKDCGGARGGYHRRARNP